MCESLNVLAVSGLLTSRQRRNSLVLSRDVTFIAAAVLFAFATVVGLPISAFAQAGLSLNGVAYPSSISARPGSAVAIGIANGPGNSTDWIGLYAVGASDYSYLDWRYMNGTQNAPTVGAASGVVNFPLPLAPGDYEFRFFANFTWQRIAVSGTVAAIYDTAISVNGVSSPTSTVARAASAVSISVSNGPGRTGDCILLYAVGASDYDYLDWRFLNGTQTRPTSGISDGTISFPMPIAPGPYEFRMFADQTWQRVTVSGVVNAAYDTVLAVNGVASPAPVVVRGERQCPSR